MLLDRFQPPTEPNAFWMDRQEAYFDAQDDYRKLKNLLEDELDDESRREEFEARLEELRTMVMDIEMEMERYADECYS